jgi:hypothetical protein
LAAALRAAELGKAGGDSAAKVVHGPRHFDRVFRAAFHIGVPSGVLREPQRLLRDVLARKARRKHEHLVEPFAVVEQLDCLLRERHVVRLAVLAFAKRPDCVLEVDVAPASGDHFARAAAGKQNEL